MKPSVEFRPTHHCGSQMCRVILKPHKSRVDISAQIAGNYVFASRGKYAQISSHNWNLLKINAVWGLKPKYILLRSKMLFAFVFFMNLELLLTIFIYQHLLVHI